MKLIKIETTKTERTDTTYRTERFTQSSFGIGPREKKIIENFQGICPFFKTKDIATELDAIARERERERAAQCSMYFILMCEEKSTKFKTRFPEKI